jgi:hypothetical protein
MQNSNGTARPSIPKVAPLSTVEALTLRLSEFPSRMVTVKMIVDGDGKLTAWVVEEAHKIEGRLRGGQLTG